MRPAAWLHGHVFSHLLFCQLAEVCCVHLARKEVARFVESYHATLVFLNAICPVLQDCLAGQHRRVRIDGSSLIKKSALGAQAPFCIGGRCEAGPWSLITEMSTGAYPSTSRRAQLISFELSGNCLRNEMPPNLDCKPIESYTSSQ